MHATSPTRACRHAAVSADEAWRRACARARAPYRDRMNVKILVHEAEEGGFWADVPALPGCASQGETMDELIANVREAIAGWLDVLPPEPGDREQLLDLAL